MNVTMLELKNNLLALPADQRAFWAQELWSSLGDKFDSENLHALAEAEKRDQELDNSLTGRTHGEVMKSMYHRLK